MRTHKIVVPKPPVELSHHRVACGGGTEMVTVCPRHAANLTPKWQRVNAESTQPGFECAICTSEVRADSLIAKGLIQGAITYKTGDEA